MKTNLQRVNSNILSFVVYVPVPVEFTNTTEINILTIFLLYV